MKTADEGATPWALVSPKGIEHLGLHRCAKEVWMIALGYPDEEEVGLRMRAGWKAVPVKALYEGGGVDTDYEQVAMKLLDALIVLWSKTPIPAVTMGDDPDNPFSLPTHITDAKAAIEDGLKVLPWVHRAGVKL